MGEEEVFFTDIDRDTIEGDASVSEPEDIQQDEMNAEKSKNRHLKLYGGVVKKVNTDDLTVDIQRGEITSDAYPNEEYRNCKILNLGTVDEADEYHGSAKLPRVGDRVVYGFLLGVEEQPVVLGTILTGDKSGAIDELNENNVKEDRYIKNGEASVLIKKTGEIIFNEGDLGVARKNDEVKSTIVEDSAFWTMWTAFFAVITGPPIPEPGNGAPSAFQTVLAAAISGAGGAPSELISKITKASDSVFAGGDSA